MVALGVDSKDSQSFFRSYWNWLDAIVVVEGIVSLSNLYILDFNLSPLRAIRALRPLRSIERLPDLRRLVDALVFSVPLLCSAFNTIAVYFAISGAIGMAFWSGSLSARCYDSSTGLLDPEDIRHCGGMHTCGMEWQWPSGEIRSHSLGNSSRSFCGQLEQSSVDGVARFENIV